MTQQPTTMTEGLLAGAGVPPAGPGSNVQIIQTDGRLLDIRDRAGHGWLMPVEYAVDLVRWWGKEGCRQAPWGALAPQQHFGQVWVSILSDRLVYVRGADAQGRPTITGYLFPRAVIEALASHGQLLAEGENVVGIAQEGPAGVGEDEATAGAGEELGADELLEGPELTAARS